MRTLFSVEESTVKSPGSPWIPVKILSRHEAVLCCKMKAGFTLWRERSLETSWESQAIPLINALYRAPSQTGRLQPHWQTSKQLLQQNLRLKIVFCLTSLCVCSRRALGTQKNSAKRSLWNQEFIRMQRMRLKVPFCKLDIQGGDWIWNFELLCWRWRLSIW